MREIDSYYLNQAEPLSSCLLALRGIILQQDPLVSETTKFGMPCFLYKNKVFCYLWTDKKTGEPYVLLVEGRLLNHPELEKGKRARMKIFRVNPEKDLPLETLRLLLNKALDLYRMGKIKAK